MAAVRSCARNASDPAVAEAACNIATKLAWAQASGRDVADISDFEVATGAREALGQELSQMMERCMANATAHGDSGTACRGMATATMREMDIRDEEPPKWRVEMALRDAGARAAREALESCSASEAECLQTMRERAAMAQGRRPEDVTEAEAREVRHRGAMDAFQGAAQACASARQDNPSATCEDAYEAFAAISGRPVPTDGRARQMDEMRIRKDAAEEMAASARKLCFEHSTELEVQACVNESKAEMQAVLGHLFAAGGQQQAGRLEQTMRQAERKALGDMHRACMTAATTAAERATCAQEMSTRAQNAGIAEDPETVLARYRATLLAATAATCDGSNATGMRQCRNHARAEAIAAGMEPRHYAAVKALGEKRAAAEAWATCREANGTEAECLAAAEVEYVAVSGATAEAFADEVKAQVQKLGNRILEGQPVVLVRQRRVHSTVITDGTVCDASVGEIMANRTAAAAEAAEPAAGNVTMGPCRLVDAFAEYSAFVAAPMPDDQIEALAGNIATTLDGQTLARRLEEVFLAAPDRRLAEVSAAFAAQAMAECAEGDDECSGSNEPATDSGSNETATSSGGAGTTDSGSDTAASGITSSASFGARTPVAAALVAAIGGALQQ